MPLFYENALSEFQGLKKAFETLRAQPEFEKNLATIKEAIQGTLNNCQTPEEKMRALFLSFGNLATIIPEVIDLTDKAQIEEFVAQFEEIKKIASQEGYDLDKNKNALSFYADYSKFLDIVETEEEITTVQKLTDFHVLLASLLQKNEALGIAASLHQAHPAAPIIAAAYKKKLSFLDIDIETAQKISDAQYKLATFLIGQTEKIKELEPTAFDIIKTTEYKASLEYVDKYKAQFLDIDLSPGDSKGAASDTSVPVGEEPVPVDLSDLAAKDDKISPLFEDLYKQAEKIHDSTLKNEYESKIGV